MYLKLTRAKHIFIILKSESFYISEKINYVGKSFRLFNENIYFLTLPKINAQVTHSEWSDVGRYEMAQCQADTKASDISIDSSHLLTISHEMSMTPRTTTPLTSISEWELHETAWIQAWSKHTLCSPWTRTVCATEKGDWNKFLFTSLHVDIHFSVKTTQKHVISLKVYKRSK